jgi:tetratricopeptide (TPR) repeat protein
MPLTRVTRLAAAAFAWWSIVAVSPTHDDIQRALDRYSAGDHDAAIAGIDRAITAGALRAAAEQWIRTGEASTLARRQRVAAAFTLEAVWVATRSAEVIWDLEWTSTWATPWDAHVSSPRSLLPIVSWGCKLISDAPAPHSADAVWLLASVGALQDVRAAGALLAYRGSPGPQPTWDPHVRRELTSGHLVHARAHTPAEPRWKLAELLAQVRELEMAPFHQRPGVLRNPVWRPQALPRIQERLEELAADAALAREVRLRVAYIEIRRGRWREALAAIERERPLLTEPFLIAVAEYLRGWASEQLGQRVEAIAAYRRSLAIAPGMRNVITLLAAQLYAANDRTEAYAILENMHAAPSHPRDLIVQFERGDARLVPEYFARLREALR